MPNINEMMESRFLRKEVLDQFPKKARKVTIESIEQGNTAREDEEPRYQWLIKFREFREPMILKSTNIKLMAAIFQSDEANDWVGRQCVLYVDPTVMMKGQIVGGMRVRAAAEPAAQVGQLAAKLTGKPAPRRQVRDAEWVDDYEKTEAAQRGPAAPGHGSMPPGSDDDEEEVI